MDSEVLSALITGLTTVLAAVLGVFIGRDHSQSKYLREFHAAQLSELYEPLVGLFLFSGDKLSEEQIETITGLLRQHNALAAPCLVKEWNSFLQAEKGNSDKFQKVLFANYHWVKKSLGYPFDADSVILKYLPERRYGKLLNIIGLIVSLLLFGLYLHIAKDAATLLQAYSRLPLMLVSYGLFVYCGSRLIKEAGRL